MIGKDNKDWKARYYDRYSSEPTQEQLLELWESKRNQKTKRDNKLVQAIIAEKYSSYLQRKKIVAEQLIDQAIQEHMYGVRGAWYVHKRAQNCFICDLITMVEQDLTIGFQIIQYSKKIGDLTFGQNEQSQGLTLTKGKVNKTKSP